MVLLILKRELAMSKSFLALRKVGLTDIFDITNGGPAIVKLNCGCLLRVSLLFPGCVYGSTKQYARSQKF